MTFPPRPRVKIQDKCPHCGELIERYFKIPNPNEIEIQRISTILLPKEKQTMDDEIISIAKVPKDTKPGFPCPKPGCMGRWYSHKPMAEYGEVVMGECNVCGEFRVRIEQ